MRFVVLCVLLACASPRPSPPAPGVASLAIATDRGRVIGREVEGVRAFLGIPYAAAPRWRPPVPVVPWSTPRDATHRGFACPQPKRTDTSEDCLNLNVWAPAGDHLPVLVWIHGGAFAHGSGGDPLFDGDRLARRAHAIVVTINYRLGALGFLSQRALAREQGRDVLPAVGLLDQQMALAWVQRNIAGFGGDPANVTVFGESAGAWSICAQLTMPASRGLFARAIVQSGSCGDALYATPDEANAQGDALAAAVGCDGADPAACLRARPAEVIVNALKYRRGQLLLPGVWWGPILDGRALPRRPLDAFRDGDFARVPVILGTARDEGALYLAMYHDASADELAWFVRTTFGEAAVAPVLAHYAIAPKAALARVVTDGIFRCNTRRAARLIAARGVPVYLYEWAHALDGPPWVHALGPTHGIDENFLFDAVTDGIGPDRSERPLVDLVEDAWGRFASTGDPGHGWPRYTADTDAHFVFDVVPHADHGLDRATCDFWDGLR